MAGVNVKMGVSGLAGFKRDMNDAAASVKALEKALQLNESALKMNGDEEQYLLNKTDLLRTAMEKQVDVMHAAQAALDTMRSNGVDPASKSFQDMQAKVYEAQKKYLDLKNELNGVETSSGGAKDNVEAMNEELQKVGQGIAWDNVADGIGKVNDMLERGAKAAYNFGKRIYQSAGGSASWADEVQTMADMYDLDAETIQRMNNAAYYVDVDTETILNARDRLARKANTEGGAKSLEELLGISITAGDRENPEQLFWDVGNAIMGMTDEMDKDTIAQEAFGRSWRELIPLFKTGQEEYQEILDKQTVISDENIKKLQEADDAMKTFELELERMKNQFWADNADKITELLQWIIDNKDAVVAALGAIGVAFGAMKLAEFGANLMKITDGLKLLGLGGNGGGGGTPSLPTGGGGGTGTSGGGGGGVSGLLTKAKGWLADQAGLFGAGGGWSVAGPLAVMGLLGKAGWDMVQANLNDERYNQVFGANDGSGDIFDKMTEQQAKLTYEYWKLWQDSGGEGSEAGLNARDALVEQFATDGIDLSNQAVNLIEDAFTLKYNERQDDLVQKLDLILEQVETGNRQEAENAKNGLTKEDVGFWKRLPSSIETAVKYGMSGVQIQVSTNVVNGIASSTAKAMGAAVSNLFK